MKLTEKQKARFWSRVDVREDNECWLWLGYTNAFGHGQFSLYTKAKYAHRVAFIIANGDIPKGLQVNHHCDTPACVNPNHLYTGTQQDNMNDKVRRGRGNKGVKHYKVILTPDDVHAIRVLWKSGEFKQKDLAKRFGVSRGCITGIIRHKNWTHI